MAGPYAGLRVFDLSHVIAGPFCTRLMVDLGADVVPATSGSDTLAEDLAAFVRTHLAGYNTPRRVVFVEEFPRTAVGKIQKHVLREMLR